MVRILLCRIALGACLAAASLGNAAAQSDADAGGDRLSVGGIIGTPLLGAASETTSVINSADTSPPTVTTTAVESSGTRVVGGAAVRYDVGNRLGVGFDLLYRKGGYFSAIDISEQTAEADEFDGDLIQLTTEASSAHFFDVPVLARYYMTDRSSSGVRPYVTGGAAVRFVSGVNSITEVTDDDLVTDTDATTIDPANDAVLGAVLGLGFRAADDVGLKVDLEFRYTRWFNPVFQSGPANSNNNQADFLVAFTF